MGEHGFADPHERGFVYKRSGIIQVAKAEKRCDQKYQQ
jgi:hypothetical protein